MKVRYRSRRMLLLRNVVLRCFPAKLAHWINVQKNVRQGQLDPEMQLLHAFLLDLNSKCGRTVAIDVGGNIGIYSQLFLDAKSRVLVFEPQPDLADYLRKVLGGEAEVFSFALGDQDSIELLHTPKVSRWRLAISKADALASLNEEALKDDPGIVEIECTEVQVRTLSSFAFEIEKCSVIKIDVEGHELEVIRGADSVIKELQPVMLVEFDRRNAEAGHNLLRNLGYTPLKIDFKSLSIAFSYSPNDFAEYLDQNNRNAIALNSSSENGQRFLECAKQNGFLIEA